MLKKIVYLLTHLLLFVNGLNYNYLMKISMFDLNVFESVRFISGSTRLWNPDWIQDDIPMASNRTLLIMYYFQATQDASKNCSCSLGSLEKIRNCCTSYPSQKRSLLENAMKEVETYACIKFVPLDQTKRPPKSNYIGITNINKCSANIGKYDREILTQMYTHDCKEYNDMLHELMHTLGFHHEHQRPDRDDYIDIDWNEVKEETKESLETKEKFSKIFNASQFPYDYKSIMHYSNSRVRKEFTILGPMSRKHGPIWYKYDVGLADQLSGTDKRKLNFYYNCNFNYRYENMDRKFPIYNKMRCEGNCCRKDIYFYEHFELMESKVTSKNYDWSKNLGPTPSMNYDYSEHDNYYIHFGDLKNAYNPNNLPTDKFEKTSFIETTPFSIAEVNDNFCLQYKRKFWGIGKMLLKIEAIFDTKSIEIIKYTLSVVEDPNWHKSSLVVRKEMEYLKIRFNVNLSKGANIGIDNIVVSGECMD